MDVQINGPMEERFDEILTPEAVAFVADLHDTFNARRRGLLSLRHDRERRLDEGGALGFLPETREIRYSDWKVAQAPADLQNRRVEITGPVERKMMINAFNSGAQGFMADFEDSNSPTWHNVIQGQVNLADAVRGTIEFTSPDGKESRLGDTPATLLVRPRGWHLVDRRLTVDNCPISASLLDFGLFLFHNGQALIDKGSGPYFYLPKLESHLEARLWNDVFVYAQDKLGIPQGTIRATVLIETITAAFEMDEILYELRDHSAGLNAGRWDYIFSFIKKFRNRPDMVLPDRAQIKMTVPFMKAYTDLLIHTAHKRGAHAMGGMSAFIPSRRDETINDIAMAQVHEDKERESRDGHDGTWVAHPDLVPVAAEAFDAVLGDKPNQLDNLREDVVRTAESLQDIDIENAHISRAGVRINVDVGIRYIASWLSGNGAAAINNLMEDAATAEISRSQVWQWVRHSAVTEHGRLIDASYVRGVADAVMARIEEEVGPDIFTHYRFKEARDLFEEVALGEHFSDFLTLPAMELLD
ncbi:MAG: malate synthase A [Acidimicrobiia bacterium]|nr:MAG: malate synthase A [Acidimicrobiia bacterium]